MARWSFINEKIAMISNISKYNIYILLAASLLFVPFLGSVHLFDWDEINFAECAREMIVSHDYFSVQINFQAFWEKPPLFIWMQAISMNIFGMNEFAARLPNALCGIATLLILFNIGRKLYDEKFGLIWVLVYAGSFLPHFYFKSGIIDPWFNLFIFAGIYFIFQFVKFNSNKHLLLSALMIGLAMLTKGPVALLIFGISVGIYFFFKRKEKLISIKQVTLFFLTIFSVGGLWFLMLYVSGNASIIKEFFNYQIRLLSTKDAGHGGPFYYHWIVLLFGCFPLSIFALRGFKMNMNNTLDQKNFLLWMKILFWVVLILFSIVKTKIIHYSSLCYFPLSFIAAYTMHKLISGEWQWKRWNSFLLMFISFIIGTAILLLPIVDKYKQEIINSGIIQDQFAVENLKAEVHWTGLELWIGLVFIFGIGFMLLLIKQRKLEFGIFGIFIISLWTVNLSMIFIVPKIEQYSQAAAIEFYQSIKDKNCSVQTIGFKSYADLFYKQKLDSISHQLRFGSSTETKVSYFISKCTSVDEIIKERPYLKELYRKNGFVFWEKITN